MSTVFSTDELHARTAEVLATVERGEEVILERDGKPVARIVPTEEAEAPHPRRKVVFGGLKDMIELKDGWDDPMTEAELAEWYDGPIFPEEQSSG